MKVKGFIIVLIGLAAVAGFSAMVMLLWNALVPSIFGLTAINFWQALGLLVLARILFGGFGHRRMMGGGMRRMRGMHGRNPIHDKWMKMTDEQRKEFINRRREWMRKGHFWRGDFGLDDDSKKENE